jgi:hypothetical protein
MSDPPDQSNDPPPTSGNITPAQARINAAIQNLEHASTEVDRLCTIIERAAKALTTARETKQLAQIELDEASKSFNGESGGVAAFDELRNGMDRMDGVGRDLVPNLSPRKSMDPDEDHVEYNEVHSEDGSEGGSEDESESGASSEYHSGSDEEASDEEASEEEASEESEPKKEKPESNNFDLGNDALDQIRYRLQIAKIDPISAVGTKLLDDLLILFQKTEEPITIDLVNRFIDELLSGKKGDPPSEAEKDGSSNNVSLENLKDEKEVTPKETPPPQNNEPTRVRINRGGKVLGWYEGGLDERGYAREGKGSMYYDAGHECHGTWKNDEMIGRGTYVWADGHKYDGEWSGGKRHGLGRFIRPDGVVLYGRYEKGHHRGEGVRWSADRKEAQSMVDGVPKKSVSLAIAEFMALKLGFEDVPPPPVL